MDQLQWNASGFCTWFSVFQALIQYCDPPISCLQEPYIYPHQALNLHGFVLHHCDHKKLAIIVKDGISCALVNFHSLPQVIAVPVNQPIPLVALWNIYFPSAVPIAVADLNNLISQLPSPSILIEISMPKYSMGISPYWWKKKKCFFMFCDVLCFKTNADTHLCLGLETLFVQSPDFCSPGLAVYLEWCVLVLCGSYHH